MKTRFSWFDTGTLNTDVLESPPCCITPVAAAFAVDVSCSGCSLCSGGALDSPRERPSASASASFPFLPFLPFVPFSLLNPFSLSSRSTSTYARSHVTSLHRYTDTEDADAETNVGRLIGAHTDERGELAADTADTEDQASDHRLEAEAPAEEGVEGHRARRRESNRRSLRHVAPRHSCGRYARCERAYPRCVRWYEASWRRGCRCPAAAPAAKKIKTGWDDSPSDLMVKWQADADAAKTNDDAVKFIDQMPSWLTQMEGDGQEPGGSLQTIARELRYVDSYAPWMGLSLKSGPPSTIPAPDALVRASRRRSSPIVSR